MWREGSSSSSSSSSNSSSSAGDSSRSVQDIYAKLKYKEDEEEKEEEEEEKEEEEEQEQEQQPPTTGITCVTPSPESITVPVSERSVACRDAQDAASDRTACTAMYRPGTLNDSNMISAEQLQSEL